MHLSLGIPLAGHNSGAWLATAFSFLSELSSGFVIDPINDAVVIKDTDAITYTGTMAQALADGILNYPSPSTKYVRNSAGIWTAGTALRSHHSAAGVPLGILSEPQRTNLWYRSSDLSVSPWAWFPTGGGETISAGDVSCYGGTLWTIAVGTTAADRRQARIVTADTQTAISLNTKRGNQALSAFEYVLFGGSGMQTLYFSYNHDTDTVTASVSGGALALNSSGRDLLANGEVRLWTVVTPSSGGTSGYLLLHRKEPNFTSTETAQYGHVQVEYGAFRTSYIKTEGSAVTRNADNLYVDVSRMPSNSDQWSVISTHRQLADTSAAITIGLGNAASPSFDNTMYISGNSTYSAALTVRNSATTYVSIVTGSPVYDARTRVACRLAEDDYAMSVDGAAVSADNSGAFPLGADRWVIGRAPWAISNHSVKPIESIVIIPELLPNAELQARSAL